MVKYQIKERGANDQSRFNKVLQFQGPDSDTLAILHDNHNEWLQNPASFWIRPLPAIFGQLDPQQNILCCYLQTVVDDA